jgi:hypothetical protein
MFLEQMTEYLVEWKPVDVREIAPLVVSYRPTRLPEPNQLHQEMLRPVPEPERLFVGAPNRDAVEHNLRASIHAFEKAVREFAPDQTGRRLTSWRDLLRMNLEHLGGAARYFTNGQTTATCLPLTDGRFSVALHDDHGLEMFRSHISTQPSLVAHRLVTVETEGEVQSLAIRWLSVVKEESIPVFVQGKPETMTWRAWGWIAAQSGYRRKGLVLKVGDRSVWTELNEWAGAAFEPYAVLNHLATVLPGVEADTCATCSSFAFSGMSRDFSGGWGGYCRHPDAQEGSGRGSPGVSVSHRCDRHTTILDANRSQPYIRVR